MKSIWTTAGVLTVLLVSVASANAQTHTCSSSYKRCKELCTRQPHPAACNAYCERSKIRCPLSGEWCVEYSPNANQRCFAVRKG